MNSGRFLPAYDVIVVGSGVGGLTSACRVANAGKSVLLLEQHNMTGGYATSFVRGRYEFEVSLHEACECGDGKDGGGTGGVYEILESLGVHPEYVRVPDCYRVILTDHNIDFTMPIGLENAIQALSKVEPGDEKKLRNYFQLCKEVFDALMYIQSCGKAGPDGKIMATKYSTFLRTAAYTVSEVNKYFQFSTKVEQILNAYYGYIGRRLSDTSFTVWALMIYLYVRDGGHIFKGTSHALAVALEKRIREKGGQVETNVRVERLLYKDGRVCGVALPDGTEIAAKYVLANILPTTVYKKMLPPEAVPEKALKLTGARRLGGSPFGVYMGLNALPQDMGITSYEYFMGRNMDTETIYNKTNEWAPHAKLSATCPDVAIPGFSGPDRCQLNFTALYDPDAMGKHADKYAYLPEKERFANTMIDYFEQVTGAHIREHIEEIEISTPATYVRYAGAFKGNIYGYVCNAVDGVVPRVLNAEKERFIPGLDFIGGGALRAHGYSSAITSGFDNAGVALEKIGGEVNG